MVSKKNVLVLTLAIVLFSGFSNFGQQSGTYEIPVSMQSIISEAELDSLLAQSALQPRTDTLVNYDSLGGFIWFGGAGLKWLESNSNKVKTTRYTCLQNGWIKSESQYDTLTKTKDYQTTTACYDISGDDFWTENIEFNVNGLNSITINSPANITVKIYEAYNINQLLTELSVTGNSTDQSFQVSLVAGKSYLAVCINDQKDIVSIKRIGA